MARGLIEAAFLGLAGQTRSLGAAPFTALSQKEPIDA
jgi:hypothetical protein